MLCESRLEALVEITKYYTKISNSVGFNSVGDISRASYIPKYFSEMV